jgi:RND family efflux transporter MFP subunit
MAAPRRRDIEFEGDLQMSTRSVVRTRALLLALLVLALVVPVTVFMYRSSSPTERGAAIQYHCPMHPSYVSDRPGDCPICGMRLVPTEQPKGKPGAPAGASPPAGAVREQPATIYTCPMHPQVRETRPGQCPLCGMDLEPATPAAVVPASGQAGAHAGHQPSAPAGGTSAASGTVELSSEQARLAGVRTVVVATGRITSAVRAVGTVVPDETRIRQVTTKVSGFVERLHVNAVGESVQAGQPLFDLYSPELLVSQEEFLRAQESAARFQQSSVPEVQRGALDLVATARRRLELFDVPPAFIERLEQGGKPQRTITFRAPFSGFVTDKKVLEGQQVEPGMDLLTLSDLSRVWVAAQVYEAEAAVARVGRPATVTLPYDGTVRLTGRVTLVYPTLDVDTRTLKLRLEFPNPRMRLKPGMFVNVELGPEGATGLIIPDSAIIESGTRQVVFVEPAPGRFEPREVRIGMRGDGQALVSAGLAEGERVAVAANFLLDSESRLRSAVGGTVHKHE